MQNITKVSQSMDVLARAILEKQRHDQQLKVEYERKLNELTQLIDIVLKLQKPTDGTGHSVDTALLDKILEQGLEIVEKNNSKYVLIPIAEDEKKDVDTDGIVDTETSNTKPKRNRKKKNKIPCSYCHEIGHTRAKCEKRLLSPKPLE